jgi:hypothetical protein
MGNSTGQRRGGLRGALPTRRCPWAPPSTSPSTRSGPQASRTATAATPCAMAWRPTGWQRAAMSGRSRGCWGRGRSRPPPGISGAPARLWRRAAARSPSCPAGRPPAHAGVTPGHRRPPLAQRRPRSARPAPHGGQAPIFSASRGRPPAVPIPSHPRRRKGCTRSRPAGRRRSGGTPPPVLPVGASGPRLMPGAIATVRRARR